MFGSTPRATSGGQLWIGTSDRDPARRDLARMALAVDRRRHAAYRRLALTVLGLDIRSLVQALPRTASGRTASERTGQRGAA